MLQLTSAAVYPVPLPKVLEVPVPGHRHETLLAMSNGYGLGR